MGYYIEAEKKIQERVATRENLKLITRWRDLKFEEQQTLSGHKRGTFNALLASPYANSGVKTLHVFVAEIPPGAQSSAHRHFNEAIIHIKSGKGYSIIDKRKITWEEGDTICVPVFAWHQHFNLDPDKPVLFLGITNWGLMEALDLSQIEHFEGDLPYDVEES